LGIYDVFWCEEMFAAVVRGGEFYAVFGEFDVNIMLLPFGKSLSPAVLWDGRGGGDFSSVY
jgi:hypothetical protein